MPKSRIITKKVVTWALYDWANSAFALSVLAVLFPLALGNYWGAEDGGSVATIRLGWVTFSASLVVFLSAPILGTIADIGDHRKRFLLLFTIIGAAATTSLGFVGQDDWPIALGFYLIASVGFYSSNVFYDSLLIDVTEPRNYSFVSNLGYSVGYLGGAVLLSLHLWMLKSPQTFGLESMTEVFNYAFISVGVWWAFFLLPLLLSVSEAHNPIEGKSYPIRAAYEKLKLTALKISQYRNIVIFLSAYWLYIGGVFTVIFMAVNYGQRLGFEDSDLVLALLISNFVGFPATLAYGFLAHRFGPKRGLYLSLFAYIGVCLWGTLMTEMREFYIMSIIIGVFQGATQGLSRSIYATLIPADQSGEFFGFYSMITKFAYVLGPAMVAIAAMLSDDPKWVLLTLVPMFLAGAFLLALVRIPAIDKL